MMAHTKAGVTIPRYAKILTIPSSQVFEYFAASIPRPIPAIERIIAASKTSSKVAGKYSLTSS
jgi:hypothetical protein